MIYQQFPIKSCLASFQWPSRCFLQGMFNDEAFGKMKKGARIVNVARGGVIDEAALARALDNGQVAQVKFCTACMHM